MAGTLAFPFNGNVMFDSSKVAANTDIKDFGQMIHRVFAGGQSPLFALLSEMETGTCLNVEHGYWQKSMIIPSATNTAAQVAGDTTIAVADSSQLIPNMVLRVPATGENIMVLTIVSGTSITVRRAVGNIAAGAIAINSVLMMVGMAFEEASNRPNSQSFNPAYIKNYTQIFRNAWSVSNTAAAIKMIVGEGNVAENKSDCMHFHSVGIETAIIFGQLYSGTLNSKPFRTMDGLVSMISNQAYYPTSFSAANVFTAGGTTSFAQLETMLESTLNQRTNSPMGSGTNRVIFTGSKGLTVINQICRVNGVYELVQGESTYGLQFSRLKTARGTFDIIEHPLFNNTALWSNCALVLDLSAIKLCYLGGRKTLPESYGFDATGANIVKVPDNGQDAVGGSLTTEMTIENLNIPAHAWITNLTAAAVGV